MHLTKIKQSEWIKYSITATMIVFIILTHILFGTGHPTEGPPTGVRFIMVIIAWSLSALSALTQTKIYHMCIFADCEDAKI